MILVGALLALLIAVPIAAAVLYFGVPLGTTGRSLDWHESVSVALVGVFLSGLAALLLGWIPVLGVLFAPLVWVGVVGYFCPVTWPAATAIALVAWAIPAVVTRIVLLI